MKKVLRRKDESIQWTALLFDLLGAYIITAISLFVLALLLYRFQITKSVIGVGIILTYLVSCFFAGNRAGKKMKQKRFLWGGIMGMAYFVVLLLISVGVNQSFGAIADSLLTTLILCVGGGMLGGMLS
jgi:putative membrane protein (TIGR04086 family)